MDRKDLKWNENFRLFNRFFRGDLFFRSLGILFICSMFLSCTKESESSKLVDYDNSISVNTVCSSGSAKALEIARDQNIQISPNYFGMHFHYWPFYNSTGNVISPAPKLSSAPNFGFGLWRSHDYYGGFNGNASNNTSTFGWDTLHESSGHITNTGIWGGANTAWNELDEVLKIQSDAGRDIMFTIFGTPSWNTSSQFKPAGISRAAPALDLSALANFIRALVTRYNTTTVFPAVRPITYLEIWNEPGVRKNSNVSFLGSTLTWEFTESTGDSSAGLPVRDDDVVFFSSSGSLPSGISSNTFYYVVDSDNSTKFSISNSVKGSPIALSGGSGVLRTHKFSNFFWGTSQEMVKMAKVIYTTAKSVDPNIKIVSPGFTPEFDLNDNDISSFLNASDGEGALGKDWIDVVAYHPYNSTVSTVNNFPNLMTSVQALKTLMNLAGLPADTPWMIGEQGWVGEDGYLSPGSDEAQARKIARHLVYSACMGAERHILYVYDEPFLGTTSMVVDSKLKQAYLNWFHTSVAGKIITDCYVMDDLSVKLTIKNEGDFCI